MNNGYIDEDVDTSTWEDNRWFMRGIRFAYNKCLEPVIKFFEATDAKWTKKFVEDDRPSE